MAKGAGNQDRAQPHLKRETGAPVNLNNNPGRLDNCPFQTWHVFKENLGVHECCPHFSIATRYRANFQKSGAPILICVNRNYAKFVSRGILGETQKTQNRVIMKKAWKP